MFSGCTSVLECNRGRWWWNRRFRQWLKQNQGI